MSLLLRRRLAACLCRRILALLLAMVGTDALARDHAYQPVLPPPATNGVMNRIDRGRDTLSGHVVVAGDRIDRYLERAFRSRRRPTSEQLEQFLSASELMDQAAGTRVIVSPSLEWGEGGTVDTHFRFSAKLQLNRLKGRLQLILNNVDEEDVLESYSQVRSPEERLDRDDDSTASLRLNLADRVRFKSSVDAGLRFRPEPVPRLKLRGEARTRFHSWRVSLRQLGFWDSDDGFGEKTSLRFTRDWRKTYLFNAVSSAVWSETSEGVDLGQTASFYWFVKKTRSIGVKLGVAGHTEPSAIVDLYTVRFPFRQRIRKNWVFMEIEPGIDYPNEEDFSASPLITFRLEFILGHTRREKEEPPPEDLVASPLERGE
jgi:hypothetical protein